MDYSATSKVKDRSQSADPRPDRFVTELRLAGPVCLVTTGQQPARLASAQAQAAVARLVMDRHGNGTTREQLADVIWPEGLPDTWASAMRSVVSRIRRFLSVSAVPGADLVSHGGRYYLQLPAAIGVDIEQAEKELAQAGSGADLEDPARALRQAENAARCFRRPFLANREGDWAAHVRQHLAGRANDALELASRAALLSNEIGAAISHSAELISRAPLRESAYRSLMRASLAAGNRGDALSAYSSLRRLLRDELGVDPSTETQQLYYEVLGSAPAPAETPPKAAQRRRPFIGRSEALDTLDQAFQFSRGGSVQLVLVTGELGIGKSRLLHEFGRHLSQSEVAVIPVHCQAYAERRCALATSLADAADAAEPGSVQARIRKRLGQIIAESSDAPGRDHLAAGFGAALTELVLEVAASVPLVLVLDDVDRADETTLEVLRRLLFHVGKPVQLTLAASATSPRSAAAFLRHGHELPQPNACTVTELQPLTPYEVHQLVSSVPGQGSQTLPGIGHLLDQSGGNPFLLSALLPDHRAEKRQDVGVSPFVIDYVHARTDSLDADSAALLRYAAAYGSAFGFDVVAKAYGSPGTAASAIGTLVRSGLLVDEVDTQQAAERDGHRYRFRHGILREAVYASLSTAERFELHTRLISVIREVHRDDPEGSIHELADQLLAKNRLGREGQASRLLETAEACRQAAAAAAQRGHSCEAIRLYRQALGLAARSDTPLRAGTLTALGRLELSSSPAEGIENLRDGTLLALQCGAIETALAGACDLADHLAGIPHLRGEAAALADLVAEDLSRLPVESLESAAMGQVLGRFMARLSVWGTQRPPLALVERAIEALSRQLAAAASPERVTSRAALADDLWQLASKVDHTGGKLLAAEHGAAAAATLGIPGSLAVWSGRLNEAVASHSEPGKFRYLTDGLALMMQVTSGNVPPGVQSQPAHAGNGPVAGLTCGANGLLSTGPGPSRQLLIARWLRAPFGNARLPQETAPWEGLPDPDGYDGYRSDDCLRNVLDGQLGTARLRLRGLLLAPLAAPDSDEAMHSLAVMAITAAELADPVAAGRIFGLLSPFRNLAACHSIFSFAGPISYHLARLARINQDLDLAQELATASIADLSAVSARPWVALAQLELAATLQMRGRPGDQRIIEALLAESARLVSYPGPIDYATAGLPASAPAGAADAVHVLQMQPG